MDAALHVRHAVVGGEDHAEAGVGGAHVAQPGLTSCLRRETGIFVRPVDAALPDRAGRGIAAGEMAEPNGAPFRDLEGHLAMGPVRLETHGERPSRDRACDADEKQASRMSCTLRRSSDFEEGRIIPVAPYETRVYGPPRPVYRRRFLPKLAPERDPRRLAPRGHEESFIEDVDPEAIRRMVAVLLIAGTLFLAVIFGSVASGEWQTLLTALHGQPFGRPDAQFGRDLSFYVFTLPALHFVQEWVLGLAVKIGRAHV